MSWNQPPYVSTRVFYCIYVVALFDALNFIQIVKYELLILTAFEYVVRAIFLYFSAYHRYNSSCCILLSY